MCNRGWKNYLDVKLMSNYFHSLDVLVHKRWKIIVYVNSFGKKIISYCQKKMNLYFRLKVNLECNTIDPKGDPMLISEKNISEYILEIIIMATCLEKEFDNHFSLVTSISAKIL